MNPADAAIERYTARWEALRAEAEEAEIAARLSPGPLTSAKLRNKAARARMYAPIAHRARYAELLDPEPAER